MEIERKFLIPDFPDRLRELSRAQVWQGYLATDPVVRIRKKQTESTASYKLCFKGEGQLVRQETELEISGEIFEELSRLLKKPLIHKDYRVYDLDGRKLECSRVDVNGKGVWYYAEIEFSSKEEAIAFCAPDFLQNEVTYQKGYTMSEYWERMENNE